MDDLLTDRPLSGVKVVEVGVWIAGPAAAGVLADWGADVVKVEPQAGDPCRMFQWLLGGELPSNPVFELDNRGKRGVVFDLTTDDGQSLLLELLADADVFVTNLRPAALERLGLDYETLAERLPRLVYAHVTGYGREGAERNKPGFDIAAYWSFSGIANLLAGPDADPPYQRGGMGDHATGLATAGAISAALFQRERTGRGQLVASSLMRMGAYQVGFDLNVALMWGVTLERNDRHSITNPATNNYRTADGRRFWIVGIDPRRHWEPLARAVGRPDLIDDERFSTPAGRAANSAELATLLDTIFATKTLAEWTAVFEGEPELFWAPINEPFDLIASEQFAAHGGLIEVPDGVSTTTMISSPVDFAGEPIRPRHVAPTLGEHTQEVLEELGRTPEQIAALIESGAVSLGPSD